MAGLSITVVDSFTVGGETYDVCDVAEDELFKAHAFVRRRGYKRRQHFETLAQAAAAAAEMRSGRKMESAE